jgi:hypothetical protein
MAATENASGSPARMTEPALVMGADITADGGQAALGLPDLQASGTHAPAAIAATTAGC